MTDELAFVETRTGVRFAIRVMPRSSRNEIGDVRDGRLVVRVTAPPVDRAANNAALTSLARALRMPATAIRVVAGQTSRNKTIELTGLGRAEVLARLGHGPS